MAWVYVITRRRSYGRSHSCSGPLPFERLPTCSLPLRRIHVQCRPPGVLSCEHFHQQTAQPAYQLGVLTCFRCEAAWVRPEPGRRYSLEGAGSDVEVCLSLLRARWCPDLRLYCPTDAFLVLDLQTLGPGSSSAFRVHVSFPPSGLSHRDNGWVSELLSEKLGSL